MCAHHLGMGEEGKGGQGSMVTSRFLIVKLRKQGEEQVWGGGKVCVWRGAHRPPGDPGGI